MAGHRRRRRNARASFADLRVGQRFRFPWDADAALLEKASASTYVVLRNRGGVKWGRHRFRIPSLTPIIALGYGTPRAVCSCANCPNCDPRCLVCKRQRRNPLASEWAKQVRHARWQARHHTAFATPFFTKGAKRGSGHTMRERKRLASESRRYARALAAAGRLDPIVRMLRRERGRRLNPNGRPERLVYFPVNAAWAFVLAPPGSPVSSWLPVTLDPPGRRFFPTRKEAVAEARSMGLTVDAKGRAHGVSRY